MTPLFSNVPSSCAASRKTKSRTCRTGGLGWTIRPHAWGRFIWPNTVNLDIRTTIESRVVRGRVVKSRGRRLRRSARAVRRAGTTLSAPNQSICLAPAPYPDVRSAGPCCRVWRVQEKGNVRSADSNSIPASSARTLIREAGSSACSRLKSESRRKMHAMSAPSTRFA